MSSEIKQPQPARSVDFAPGIVIDGVPLPWPLSLEYSTDYVAYTWRKHATLEFAVLASTVTGLPNQIVIDGHPVSWLLSEPPYVTRQGSATYQVRLKVVVDTGYEKVAA